MPLIFTNFQHCTNSNVVWLSLILITIVQHYFFREMWLFSYAAKHFSQRLPMWTYSGKRQIDYYSKRAHLYRFSSHVINLETSYLSKKTLIMKNRKGRCLFIPLLDKVVSCYHSSYVNKLEPLYFKVITSDLLRSQKRCVIRCLESLEEKWALAA